MERAARSNRLDDFLRGKRKEQGHPDIVDHEMKRMSDVLVALMCCICPHERQHRTGDQET